MDRIKDNPTVSVIIPTCNRARIVGRAIRSVLNQTYQNFEIFVVDDASNDNTEAVVRNFNDERIKYIRHDKNRGGSAARNTGIKASKGQYIALLDDDDEWLPEKLEKQINKFKNSKDSVGVVYGGHITFSSKTGKIIDRSIPVARGVVYPYTLKSGLASGGSMPLIKKECFEKVGLFDETLPALQDGDMWVRISQHYEFEFVPDYLAKYYVHKGRDLSDLEKIIEAREKFIRKHFAELSKFPSCFSEQLNWLGMLYSFVGNRAEARRAFLKSIKKKPVQRFAYFHLFLLLFFPNLYRRILERKIWGMLMRF